MADEPRKGRLTDEQLTLVDDWLDERLPELSCPLCEQQEWTVGPYSVRLQASGQLIGGIGYPEVVLTCDHCANTVLLNMVVMGLEIGGPIVFNESAVDH